MFRTICTNMRNLKIALHILGILNLCTNLKIASCVYDCATLVRNLDCERLTSRKWLGSRVDKWPPAPLQSWALYKHLWPPSLACSFRLSSNHPRPLRLVSNRHHCFVTLTSGAPLSNKKYCSSFVANNKMHGMLHMFPEYVILASHFVHLTVFERSP